MAGREQSARSWAVICTQLRAAGLRITINTEQAERYVYNLATKQAGYSYAGFHPNVVYHILSVILFLLAFYGALPVPPESTYAHMYRANMFKGTSDIDDFRRRWANNSGF